MHQCHLMLSSTVLYSWLHTLPVSPPEPILHVRSSTKHFEQIQSGTDENRLCTRIGSPRAQSGVRRHVQRCHQVAGYGQGEQPCSTADVHWNPLEPATRLLSCVPASWIAPTSVTLQCHQLI